MVKNKDVQEFLDKHEWLIRWTTRDWVNSTEYDDIVQEARIGMLAAYRSYNSKIGLFSTWATLYIRGYIKHWLRDKGRTIRLPMSQQQSEVAPVCCDMEFYEHEYAGSDGVDELVEVLDVELALNKLSEIERGILKSLFFDDMSTTALAAKLGLTYSIVARIKKNALQRLQGLLEDYNG